MSDAPQIAGDRLAKVMARAGLCSRRDAEEWIRAGRVTVNGKKIMTPAFNVAPGDDIAVDGDPLSARAGTRLWLYHKPRGLVVTEKDPDGRATIFSDLEGKGLPRVVSVGRLDINTEGLLLLTNDGGLKRVLELPSTGWLRKYRVRAHGTAAQADLDKLKAGIEIDGVNYGPIEVTLERQQGSNVWLEVALREGKNREVKNVLASLGLEVNRLIRVSFGPFQLGELAAGAVEPVRSRVLKDQLGARLAREAGVDFDSELPETAPVVSRNGGPARQPSGRGAPGGGGARPARSFGDAGRPAGAGERPRRAGTAPGGRGGDARSFGERAGQGAGPRPRRIHFDDGRVETFEEKTYGRAPKGAGGKRGDTDGKPAGPHVFGKPHQRDAGARPSRSGGTGRAEPKFGDKPRRPRADGDAPRPARAYKPRAEGSGDARPPRSFSDKPRAGAFAGKPPRARQEGEAGRPARVYKPRAEGETSRPPRAYKPRTEGDARPARAYKPRAEATSTDARPARVYKPRPQGDKPSANADRPARAYKPHSGPNTRKPAAAGAGKTPFRPRSGGPVGARPAGARPAGGKPSGKSDGPRRPPRNK